MKDTNTVELDELDDLNKNVSYDYVELNEDAEHEHLIDIKETPVLKDVCHSDILIVKQELQVSSL
jgi:hypothetical protein